MSSSSRDSATDHHDAMRAAPADEALSLIERALSLLDASAGPADVGAQLDLAIHRLKEWLASKKS